MIVDSSALIAIFADEEDASKYLDAIEQAPHAVISSMTFLETGIVMARRYVTERMGEFVAFLEAEDIEVVPFTAAQAGRAIQAYRTYGRAFHPAALNFGDCAVYALAMERSEPLLFKGDDFSKTDVPSALI